MFKSSQQVGPLFNGEAPLASYTAAPLADFQRLMRDTTYQLISRKAPNAIAAYHSGEAESMLMDPIRTSLAPDAATGRIYSFREQLLERAKTLLAAARFMRIFPDKDLSKSIARGGFSREMYSPGVPGAGSAITRNLGDIIVQAAAISLATAASRAAPPAMAGVDAWLDVVLNNVGRRPLTISPVGPKIGGGREPGQGTTSALLLMAEITKRRDDEDWPDAMAKYFLILKYLEFSERTDDLLYAADFTSVAFTRFVSTRFRDYAGLYVSAASMADLFDVHHTVATAEGTLAYLGDARTPMTTVTDLKQAITAALSVDRVRLASQLSTQIIGGYSDWIEGYGAKYVAPNLSHFTMAMADSAAKAHLPLMPTFIDVKRGLPIHKFIAGEAEIEQARVNSLSLLRQALAKANVFSANVPQLEPGSDLFAADLGVTMVRPNPLLPRLSTVTDAGPTTAGIVSTHVDDQGRLVDDLLPHMASLFNYTVEAITRAPALASRAGTFTTPPGVGLPEEATLLPVPINYLEGERFYPLALGMRDLPPMQGSDLLRFLDSYLVTLQDGELPYVLAQLSSAFVVCWKGTIPAVLAPMIADSYEPAPGWRALLPTESVAYSYGVPLSDLLLAQQPGPGEATYPTIITHPDEFVQVGLMPLRVVPGPRAGRYSLEYVMGSRHKLVPSFKGIDLKPVYQLAHFTSMRLPAHALGWHSVERDKPNQPRLHTVQHGVIVVYDEDTVGYLDESVLTGVVMPWKGVSPRVSGPLVPVERSVETPAPEATGKETAI